MSAMQPGDVLVVTSKSFFGKLIGWRTGSEYRHCAGWHHTDLRGVQYGLEARPTSVGWVDVKKYLDDHWTITNQGQPGRTAEERAAVADRMKALIGTPYDWGALLGDAAPFLRRELDRLWAAAKRGQEPLVCSAYMAAVYETAGWPHPGGSKYRWVMPSDWATWIVDNGWDKP